MKNRIIEYSNLTPGAIYFNPKVIYFEGEKLLIKTTETAAEDSDIYIKCIDTNSGDLLWTVLPEYENNRYVYYYDESLYADGKFIVKLNNRSYIIISEDGSDVNYFKLNYNY